MKWQKTANPAYIEAMRGLRRSNAATPHDPRPNRQRTRMDRKRNAIHDSMNV
ncbi:hypothetical protein [Bifidobacterium sp. SO1]|uniref:hypothetical protein n=1 Tax=Bifidobacterium sp. SO1 TaxID=2809029 RepID=UPI001BDBECCB|nr:hypothetical protein [Bifidobacterium sp. SO1]MBT1162778.1 hypothetical protein [Bifidobacterium sp. SO1]